GPPLVHVDAYRLRDALDLDDLDLDLDGSVTVVEWGRGLVDAITDEWLEVELERPRAGGAPAGSRPGEASEPDAVGGQGDRADSADDKSDAEDPEDLDAPRTVRLRPVGPRWSTPGATSALNELGARAGDRRA
ncbi:MAG: tRNA (adenosine(37)-N6)-threonylcarbamoyltransferase complex ATPase subunit type 1 TsaE, partial [Pseudoclavibacter sp.]